MISRAMPEDRHQSDETDHLGTEDRRVDASKCRSARDGVDEAQERELPRIALDDQKLANFRFS